MFGKLWQLFSSNHLHIYDQCFNWWIDILKYTIFYENEKRNKAHQWRQKHQSFTIFDLFSVKIVCIFWRPEFCWSFRCFIFFIILLSVTKAIDMFPVDMNLRGLSHFIKFDLFSESSFWDTWRTFCRSCSRLKRSRNRTVILKTVELATIKYFSPVSVSASRTWVKQSHDEMKDCFM